MRTNSRSRGRGLVLAVLTMVVSLPELAQAQQTGLFPLEPIKPAAGSVRPGRPDLQNLQASVFRLSPDVLAAVPSGWGCPSREAPDREQSFKDIPLQAGDRLETLDRPGMDERCCRAARWDPASIAGAARRPLAVRG